MPKAERSVCTIKEQTHCTISDLPYCFYPKLMVQACVSNAVKHLNQLPSLSGISNTLSPASMILGVPPPDFGSVIRLRFGDYVQALDKTTSKPTNSQNPRTLRAIPLYPTDNTYNTWYFMSLHSGAKFHSNVWKILPISDAIIDRVHALAMNNSNPKSSMIILYINIDFVGNLCQSVSKPHTQNTT